MSGLLAVFDRSGATVDAEVCERMMQALPAYGPDGETVWADGPIALGFQRFIATPQDTLRAQPLTSLQGAYAVVADARLDNREQLGDALGVARPHLLELADADLLLRAYLVWGHGCLERLVGDFAFVIWDRARRELFVGRDALGARSACFYLDARWCVVASSATQVLAHPVVRRVIDDGKVAEYLAGLYVDQRATFYRDVSYCLPAHGMVIGVDSRREWQYWSVGPQEELRYRHDQEYVEHYRHLLTEAVRCRLRTQHRVSISLSGGLDSTILAAVVAAELGKPVTASGDRLKSFSYAFDRFTACDERAQIRPVVDHLQLDAAYTTCDGCWTLSEPATWPVDREYVTSDPYVRLPLAVVKRAAQAGSRLLLGGYYGDTLFNGSRYWAASLLRQGRWHTVANQMWTRAGELDWREALIQNGLAPVLPTAFKQPVRRWRAQRQIGAPAHLHPDLVARAAVSDRLADDRKFLQEWPTDLRARYRSLFVNLFAQGSAAVRILYNQFSVELEQPYYDRRLVEFAMRVPAHQLGMPGSDRPLARAAFRELLPTAIMDHRVRANFLPLMEEGLLHKERAFVAQLMQDPLVVAQRYVPAEWLQAEWETLSGGLGEHNQYGYAIWKVICLELWLRRVS